MTVKELYQLAVSRGLEDATVAVTYEPDDDWYALEKEGVENEVQFADDPERGKLCVLEVLSIHA